MSEATQIRDKVDEMIGKDRMATIDDELKAMTIVWGALEPLEEGSRDRVIRAACIMLGLDKGWGIR
jgi:hypothetical protein